MFEKMKIRFYQFILLDILFLPFLKPFAVTISMIPTLLWNLKKVKLYFKDIRNMILLVFVIFAFLSLLWSFFNLNDLVLYDGIMENRKIDNIILFILLVLLVVYFFYFKNTNDFSMNDLNNFLKMFIYFNFILSFIFWFDFQLYFQIRSIWTLTSLPIPETLQNFVRFTGIFSDPNNVSVAIVATYSFILVYEFTLKKYFVYSFLTVFILISTMSSTGVIAFLIATIIILYYFMFHKIKKNKLLKSSFIFFFILFLSIITISFLEYFDIKLINLFMERISNNSADSRLNKIFLYLNSDELINTFLIGQGGSIFIDGIANKPHIGHLHMIFNYGFWSWICFLFIFFIPNLKKHIVNYLPIFILLIGFTSNTGIIDFRFAMLFAIITGSYFNKNFASVGIKI